MKYSNVAKGYGCFLPKPVILMPEHERWRAVAKELKLSRLAILRLNWIIHYFEGNTATQTARHYGISTKTFYKWFGQFDRDNLYTLYLLEDKSKAPLKVRQREITNIQEDRIVKLRKERIRYGKMKLEKIYMGGIFKRD